MNVPDDLRYSKDHEWARLDDGRVRIGITDYAQDALGDVVFVQIPAVGTRVAQGDSFSEVESTKSVSDIYAPLSGTVVEVNQELADAPQRVNEDPYGEGWLVVIEADDVSQLDQLLDADAYRALIEGRGLLQPVRASQRVGGELLLVLWRAARAGARRTHDDHVQHRRAPGGG
jgi:glycine cleavage system H protein